MIKPIAAAIAPKVIMFRLYPMLESTVMVSNNVMGIVINMVVLALRERKNKKATTIANNIQMLSFTLLMVRLTKSA